MNAKDLCLSLVQCESEDEIIDLLTKAKYWDRSDDWQYFGGDENNYSVIGNQQSRPEAAIVEKVINSVDAILMGECLRRGINPEGENAPKNIADALIQFYKIPDGKLTNIPPRERSRLAEHIMLIATGAKTNPNYAIADSGEGQSPSKLHDTILSVRKSNKLKIPFVQGKFNMGGTGVLRFCGERNIQLIISKRDPEIAKNDTDPMGNFWGFTIVRRDDPRHGARSSNYKYLAPSKQILFFESESLNILPGVYPNAYEKPMYWGTYIKFFEYKIGPGLKTNILFDLYNKLSLLMPQIALPTKLYERRKDYSGHSFETVLSGLSVRVDEDRTENIEENFPTSGTMTVSGQKMKYSIYVFKKGKHEKFTKDEGIVFAINGQTHGHISKSFFTRKSVGLSYLSDSILVILDCTEIDGRSREDLFMNSRDRLSNCILKTDIEKELEEVLKEHKGLRILKDKRRKEEIENKLNDQQAFTDVLQEILKKSPTLSRLFIQGHKLQNPFDLTEGAKTEIYNGKEFPSFFKLTRTYPTPSPKLAHLNSKFRVEYSTDVSNDFFDRGKDPGSFKLWINGKESGDADINLWNGHGHLNVLLEGFNVGDVIHFKSEIFDLSHAVPITEEFHVKVVEPLKKSKSPSSGERKPPIADESGVGGKKATSGFALPNIIEVTKDRRSGHSWSEQEFNEHSALKVKGSQIDGYDFFVNVDNIYLLSELKGAKDHEIQALNAKYKFGLVLIGIALLNDFNNGEHNDENNVVEVIRKTSIAISSVIIPLIDSLGAIDIQDIVALPEEQV
jgi:hypothetical protein